MFVKSKLKVQTKVSLQCNTVHTISTNTSTCQPNNDICPTTEEISTASTTNPDCSKCQVKSFLGSQVKPVLQKLIKKHR